MKPGAASGHSSAGQDSDEKRDYGDGGKNHLMVDCVELKPGSKANRPARATADFQKYDKNDIVNNATMGFRRQTCQRPTRCRRGQGPTSAMGQDTSGAQGKFQFKRRTRQPSSIDCAESQSSRHSGCRQSCDLDTYRQDIAQGTLQFFIFSWFADYPSYRMMIAPLFASSSGPDSSNLTQYSNPAADKLFQDALSQASPDDRNASYHQAEQLIMADLPIVPIDWTSANLIKGSNTR